MRLFISKLIRIIKKKYIPNTCHAYQWLPQSIYQTCDCSVFCKFTPKGNTQIPIITLSTLLAFDLLYYKKNKKKIEVILVN